MSSNTVHRKLAITIGIAHSYCGKGSVKHLSWKCSNSHLGTWCSSKVLSRKHYSDVYVNDVLIPSCILLSGNNYTKFKLFCKFLNLASPEMLSFSRNQNVFCFPEILEFWECMKKEAVETIKPYSDICICGDSRNDSPGHSARDGVYVAMEHFTKIVLDLEVMDAREVGGVSTSMELEGMTRILKRLCNQIMIGEIITDASSSVTKRIRELKESCPSLINTFHAYDTWHKAKCLSKALHKKAKEKGNGDLVPWIEPIINHFWYACEQCKQDVSKLKEMLVGIVHHVCGEHEWGLSQCLHGQLSEQGPKTYLKKNSKPAEALREIIYDKRLLSSLHFYTHFRHTSDLESFNSMMTKYVPKRIAFEYMSFICRTALAGIDHNMHAFREVSTTKDVRKCYKRRYSKRSKRYHAELLHVAKEYSHIPLLLARILRRRKLHMQS